MSESRRPYPSTSSIRWTRAEGEMPPLTEDDDPAETAWSREAERQNIARALDAGEMLAWPDGTTSTVQDRLDRIDELAAENARLRVIEARAVECQHGALAPALRKHAAWIVTGEVAP